MEYSNNEEYKNKSLVYLFSYYCKNNFLEELFNLFEEHKDNISFFEENKEDYEDLTFEELVEQENLPLIITSGYRKGSKTKQGIPSSLSCS